jgi:23S rRNA (uracil1939-C5)-methyltransferase
VLVTINDTAYGGSGVGRLESGKAVFVPFTVTGDVVKIDLIEDKGSFAIGELREIVTPSEHRVKPHCKYHSICGGCHFGHISYDYQLEIKKDIVKNAFRKYPHKLPELNVVNDNPLGYRIRATVRALNGQVGFFRNNSNEFVPVESCPVIKPELYAKVSAFVAREPSEKLYSMPVIENPAGEAIIMVSPPPRGEGVQRTGEGIAGIHCGKVYGVSYLPYQTAAGEIPVSYGGFFQANRYLIDEFQSYAAGLAGGRVLELYAGSGFFTAAMMKNGCAVNALEMNSTAVELAKRYGYPVAAGDASDISKIKDFYNTIFVDPPREGVARRTLADILTLNPERVVYVSCNPMTLARDLSRLSDRYKITEWTLFDMFPHTYHVETVVLLQKVRII